MSINDFVEINIFLCFSICAKMQGFIDQCVFFFFFFFFTEIQDGHQKWQENDFWGNLPVESADTLWVKNFIEIALPHTVSEINVFCIYRRNLRWLPKIAGKSFLRKVVGTFCRYPVGQKICRNRSISHRFRDIKDFSFSALRKIVPFS